MSIQLIIIVLYFALTVFIGIKSSKNSKSSDSFHGAGLGIMMCVAAGTGEWLGGTSTSGVSEYGYEFGISGAWYTIANGLGVMVLALFFAELYRSLETVTIPGIIENYIGVKARIVSSVLLTFVMIAVGAAQIIAVGTLGVTVLGLKYSTSVIILGLGIILYTMRGGMLAVGYTNILHLIAMYGGVIFAVILVGTDIGGISVLKTNLPESYFSMSAIGMPKVSSWVIASVLGACTAQAGIQPLLAAKSVKTAKKSAFITAAIVVPFGILTALLGMIAKVKFPELANAKLALPTLMMNLNPLSGGIVLASVMAAILSTVSPIILAAGTMMTKDIYQRVINPDCDDYKILLVSKATTGVSGLVCILLALMMYGSTRILDLVYFGYSIRGALFVTLLYGIYWKKLTQKGAIQGMILTVIISLFWVIFKSITGSFPIHPNFTETYIAVLVATLGTFIFSKISFKNSI